VPDVATERTGIYDVYCTDTEGNHFLVEMQRNRQIYFKERALYYATFPITQQVRKGEREHPFKLLPIYVTSVLSFRMDNGPDYLQRVQLVNTRTGKVFYNNLTFVFIELPRFTKTLEQLETGTDRWLYLLRHMPELSEIPERLQADPYRLMFQLAEEAALSPSERMSYHGSLKQTLDERGWYHTGRQEGREEGLQEGQKKGREEGLQEGQKKGREEGLQEGQKKGREKGLQEGKREIARSLLAEGMPPPAVARITGLSLEDIAHIGNTSE
jgi:predicted transposase/invertase (TIGR01784 family)